jgi:23S rRNA maturation mini-RNase III
MIEELLLNLFYLIQMNLGAAEILLLGSAAIIGYFFIAEMVKQVREKDWTLVIVLSAIIIMGLFLVFIAYYNQQPALDDLSDTESDNVDVDNDGRDTGDDPDSALVGGSTKQVRTIPTDFKEVEGVEITIGDPVQPEVAQMGYAKFKDICMTPAFLTKMSDALRQSLKIKYELYTKFRRRLQHEMKTFGKQEEGIAGIISNMRNESLTSVKSALDQVNTLLKEIPNRLRNTTIETTRRGLNNALYDQTNGLERITGRQEIKDFLSLRLYAFAKNPKVFMSTFQHMAIYAPSGYGKTKIATTIGHVYASVGILFRGNVISMTKANVVSPFVNETSQKTKALLLSTLESVVFMDEAYDITPPKSLMGQGLDHGHEAITEIVNFTDKTIGMNLIIVAGYEDDMKERFMAANQGLARRFPHEIVLSAYSAKELTSILIGFLQETNSDLNLDSGMVNYLYTLVVSIVNERPDLFDKQAGAMQNLASEINHAILGSEAGCSKPAIRTGFNRFLSILGHGIVES